MKKLLLCMLLLPLLFVSVATNTVPASSPIVQAAASDDPSLDNPFCGQITPPCPFFEPCPEGSHVDRACAAACCATYQAEVKAANDAACLLYNYCLDKHLKLLTQISEDFSACLAGGVSPDICVALNRASKDAANQALAEDKLGVQHILAGRLQAALDKYFKCLLECECIEDPPQPSVLK